MLDTAPRTKFKSGEIIFREGDMGNNFYVILSGKVQISKACEKKESVLAVIGKNSVFGEMALIDHEPRSATALALTDVECYVLDEEQFFKRYDKMEPFMQGLFRIMAMNIRDLNEKIMK